MSSHRLNLKLEDLIILQRPELGLHAIIAIHSTQLGLAFGGVRRRPYPSQELALADVLALAAAMTLKCALAKLPAGGAKTVILDHPGLDLPNAYRALGARIEQLNGRYSCGPDMGTGPQALAWIREQTSHVNPVTNDASVATAAGVLAGLRAVAKQLETPLSSLRFLLQGLGGVGLRLAAALIEAGATVSGWDPNPHACEGAHAAGVEVLSEAVALTRLRAQKDAQQRESGPPRVDVFVPCALGGVIDEALAEVIACQAVCGAANNPLSGDADTILHRRGILYAPDILVNAGAVIEGVLVVLEGDTPETRRRVKARIEGIEDRCGEIFRRAQARGLPPGRCAREWGEELVLEGSPEVK